MSAQKRQQCKSLGGGGTSSEQKNPRDEAADKGSIAENFGVEKKDQKCIPPGKGRGSQRGKKGRTKQGSKRRVEYNPARSLARNIEDKLTSDRREDQP